MSGEEKGTGRVELRVRYAETDQMRRAHHMHYVAWFELGRTALMREYGISYAQLETEGLFLPVAGLSVEYRRGTGYDERIAVLTRVRSVRSRSVDFGYEVRSVPGDELLATGETRLVCTGPDMRPRRLPGPIRETLASLERRTGP